MNWLKTKINPKLKENPKLFVFWSIFYALIIGATFLYCYQEAPKLYQYIKIGRAYAAVSPSKDNLAAVSASTKAPEALLKKYFPNNWETMERIMICESQGIANKVGDEHLTYENGQGASYGLLQIRDIGDRIDDPTKLFDPETNIRMAREIFDRQGYGAWINCANKLGLKN